MEFGILTYLDLNLCAKHIRLQLVTIEQKKKKGNPIEVSQIRSQTDGVRL